MTSSHKVLQMLTKLSLKSNKEYEELTNQLSRLNMKGKGKGKEWSNLRHIDVIYIYNSTKQGTRDSHQFVLLIADAYQGNRDTLRK